MNKHGLTYKRLEDVCDFTRGLTYKGKDEVDYSSNVVLRSNNVDLATYTLNLDDLKYIAEDISIPEDKFIKKNTLLICMSNGSKQHLGKVAFIDRDYPYAFGGFMGLIKPNETEIFPKYVYYYCCSPKYKSFCSQSAMAQISTTCVFLILVKINYLCRRWRSRWRLWRSWTR